MVDQLIVTLWYHLTAELGHHYNILMTNQLPLWPRVSQLTNKMGMFLTCMVLAGLCGGWCWCDMTLRGPSMTLAESVTFTDSTTLGDGITGVANICWVAMETWCCCCCCWACCCWWWCCCCCCWCCCCWWCCWCWLCWCCCCCWSGCAMAMLLIVLGRGSEKKHGSC